MSLRCIRCCCCCCLFVYNTDRAEKCTICQEEYQLDEEIKSLPCDHLYHERCAKAWLQRVSAVIKSCLVGLCRI